MRMDEMTPGQEGVIDEITDTELPCVQRLLLFGLVEGTTVKYVSSVSRHGPLEIEIYGTRLALRKDCAAHFIVRKTT